MRSNTRLRCLASGLAILALATVGMLAGVEPFATWYYSFAWYGTLLSLDAAVALRSGEFHLLGRRAYLATLLVWSAVLWLFFELLNLRLRNWHYVFVPESAAQRWLGTCVAFATVLPAVFVTHRLLETFGVADRLRWRRLRITPGLLGSSKLAGTLALALPLAQPRLFYPLVWVALTLLLEPLNYRRDPKRSLLGDLEAGRPGRLLRLLGAGMVVGLLWELFNIEARSKWIYTVPGFERLKLFEMPILGFLGFPPFALQCFAAWQALVLSGLAVPRHGRFVLVSARRRIGVAALAALLAAAAVAGMEARTVSSYTPRLDDLPGVPTAALGRAGYDVFSLATASPPEVAAVVGPPHPSEAAARGWVQAARLAALKGIGTSNLRRLRAVGVTSVEELAAQDADSLSRRLLRSSPSDTRHETGEQGDIAGRIGLEPAHPPATILEGEVVPARVRVWVNAAREEPAEP